MDLNKAMVQRHMVRRYTDKPIPTEIVEKLNQYLKKTNEQYGLSIDLKINDTRAFTTIAKLLFAKGVRNFFIMAGQDRANLDEMLGYCGAGLMLYAQTLGLNTWWVGGTFNRKMMEKISSGNRVAGIIAVGYGQTQGVPHKSKTAEQVSSDINHMPPWFRKGIDAALLAPTALARQAFTINGSNNNISILCNSGIFTGVDTGLVKYHFELGAGKENFEWI